MILSPEFIKKIEIEYLRLLAKLLRDGKINRKTAKDASIEYLKLLPISSSEDLMAKISPFVKQYPQLYAYEIYLLHEIEEIKTQKVLEKMRIYLKSDKIDEAISLVQT